MGRLARAAALAALTFAGSATFAGFAPAAEVKMAVRTDASSIDPHYHVSKICRYTAVFGEYT